jgi:hypothetical protein
MQLRYLQTLTSIAGDKSSTIVFPMPGELMNLMLRPQSSQGQEAPPQKP